MISDAAAAISALQADPGVPARGVIALCDFGGTGTSITLLDAIRGYAPLGATVRHTDFSGDLIDQALLTHPISDLSPAAAVDATGHVGTRAAAPASRPLGGREGAPLRHHRDHTDGGTTRASAATSA